jgi:hypothetical protein
MRINTTDDIDGGPWWHKTSARHSAVLIVRYGNLSTIILPNMVLHSGHLRRNTKSCALRKTKCMVKTEE